MTGASSGKKPREVEVPASKGYTLFEGRVHRVCTLARFVGTALVVHPVDGRWVVSVRVERILGGDALIPGQTVNFVIHSPVQLLLMPGESAVGRVFLLKYRVERDATKVRHRLLLAGGPEDHEQD
jgi:hypothetical protein